jgi:hypothetical protein
MAKPSVGNAAGVALLVLNVSGVPGLIKSVGDDTPKQQAIGYGLALAVGGASSWLGRTPWPFLGTVAMCLLMLHLQRESGASNLPGPAGV